MSKKIYLSSSNQGSNPYAAGGTNEMIQCNRMADAAKIALERCGFQVKKAPQGQSMGTSITESNNWGADLHLPLHTNAFNGSADGAYVMVYSDTQRNMNAAKCLYDSIFAVTPGRTRRSIGVRQDLAELRDTAALAVYLEIDFHDIVHIAQWLIDNPKTVGEAIAKGVCNYFGITYKSAENPAPQPYSGRLYRVQVGAFRDIANAQRREQALKDSGFSTYLLKCSDGIYRVQTGAFSVKSNAEAQLEKAKGLGFSDAFIVEG